MQRNHFGATNKSKLLCRTVKAVVSYESVSFCTHLQGDSNLDASGQRSLILRWHICNYKPVGPTTKHQKAILSNLVLHVYRKHQSYLSTVIGQLITVAFFFGVQSCKYYATPKVKDKRTCILRKGVIRFFRGKRKLLHRSVCIHLANNM